VPNRYGLTGQERDRETASNADATGEMHYRARGYSPRQMRFLQNDPPVGNRAEQHYAYVANNPISLRDPEGTDPCRHCGNEKCTCPSYLRKTVQLRNAAAAEAAAQPTPAPAVPKLSEAELKRDLSALYGNEVELFRNSAGILHVRIPGGLVDSWDEAKIQMGAHIGEITELTLGINVTNPTPTQIALLAVNLFLHGAASKLATAAEKAEVARTVFSRAVTEAKTVQRAVQVATAAGREYAPMTIVRALKHGEKIEDIANEMKGLTFTADKEHAIVTLANGERAIVSGGKHGIIFDTDKVKRVIAHTHPYSSPGTGVSVDDLDMLQKLGQQRSYLLERGRVFRFNADGSVGEIQLPKK